MAEFNKFRDREIMYEYYGVRTSSITSAINTNVEGLINSAIKDSQKKLSLKYPEDKVKETLESMRVSYLTSLKKHGAEIDAIVDEAFKLPSRMEIEDADADGDPDFTEDKIDQELEELKLKVMSLRECRAELMHAEQKLSCELAFNKDFIEALKKLEGTAQQRHSEMQFIQQMCENEPRRTSTNELENIVSRMSMD